MKYLKSLIAWTPAHDALAGCETEPPGSIKVGPWPDASGWSDGYAYTGGACDLPLHKKSKSERLAMLFIEFHTCVVRDGIDPQAAHEAFLAIDEYRRHISPDIQAWRLMADISDEEWLREFELYRAKHPNAFQS